MSDINNSEYWEHRYEGNNTQWDIGYPSTPIVDYIDRIKDKTLSILIPGCGNAHEAKYILEKGFTNLTLIDIAPHPVARLRAALEHYSKEVKIIEGDFFNMDGQFDLIIEQTFFCALTPDKRFAYAQQMKRLLSPKGKLVGLLFNRGFEGGPPFGGRREEYETLFSSVFRRVELEHCKNSIPPRAGEELFIKIS